MTTENHGVGRAVGPYADIGPPPTALVTEIPELRHFGLTELARAAQIVIVLGVSVLVAGLRWVWIRPRGNLPATISEGVVQGFESLGPTFVKLGQLMASSPGVFPPVLADACLRCLDDVAAVPAHMVRRTVERDLGHPVSQLFASFDDVPLSAASVAQVHACTLHDGRDAVIKVQRPGIRHRMRVDLRVAFLGATILERFVEFFRIANATAIIRDLHHVSAAELNSAAEAQRQVRFRQNLHVFGDNRGVMVPEVYWELCGPRVICMERVYGVPISRLDPEASSVDQQLCLRRGVKAWFEAVVLHGPFHGDVHAGNLWVLDDGRVAMLDFGIVGELSEQWRDVLRKMLYASLFDGNFTPAAEALRATGFTANTGLTDTIVGVQLREVFAPLLGHGAAGLRLSALIVALVQAGKQWGVAAPEELVLFGKQLGYFERYANRAAPDWVLGRDLFLFRNVFPDAVAAQGRDLPD